MLLQMDYLCPQLRKANMSYLLGGKIPFASSYDNCVLNLPHLQEMNPLFLVVIILAQKT